MSDWWELYAASIPDEADLVASRDAPDGSVASSGTRTGLVDTQVRRS